MRKHKSKKINPKVPTDLEKKKKSSIPFLKKKKKKKNQTRLFNLEDFQ